MLFKRTVVQEDIPVNTTIVTPAQPPSVERNTYVERDSGVSSGTAVALVLLGVIAVAMVWYFAWYQPQTVVTQPPSSTTIIHDNGAAAQPIVNNPPSIVVNPPANQTPSTTIVNPPANNTTIVNPPSGATATTGGTDSGATAGTAPPATDNNGG